MPGKPQHIRERKGRAMDYKSPYEIRREGERAYERGSGSFRNPYDQYGDYDERRARDEWDYGYRSARRHEEERQEQEEYESRKEEYYAQQEAMVREAEEPLKGADHDE